MSDIDTAETGTTGKPESPMNDDGNIQIGIGIQPENSKVIVNFGKPIAWVGLGPVEAVELASLILTNVVALVRPQPQPQQQPAPAAPGLTNGGGAP